MELKSKFKRCDLRNITNGTGVETDSNKITLVTGNCLRLLTQALASANQVTAHARGKCSSQGLYVTECFPANFGYHGTILLKQNQFNTALIITTKVGKLHLPTFRCHCTVHNPLLSILVLRPFLGQVPSHLVISTGCSQNTMKRKNMN